MKNGELFLNHLPEIKINNRYSKSIKENNKESLIKKIKDKNIIKFQRNIEVINHIKNWSRNISNMKFNKRKKFSNQEKTLNNNKLYSIINNTNKNKLGYNLTISCSLKENKTNQDSNNKQNDIKSNFKKLGEISNQNNNSIVNTNNFSKNYFSSFEDTIIFQDNKKKISINNNRYTSYLSDNNNTPNLIKSKNIFELSTNNIKKINNIFNKFPLDNNIINYNSINIGHIKNNNKNRNISFTNLNNRKKSINRENSTLNNNILNDNKKDIEVNIEEKKNKRKYFISQNSKKGKNLLNISKIKYKLIVPNLMNSSSSNFKGHNFRNLEDDKNSNNKNDNNDEIFLKDLKYHQNYNNVENFIIILKHHISIEIEVNNIIEIIFIQNNRKESINLIKSLINKYNDFFNSIGNISFEIEIFLYNEYNKLLQKILKLLICLHTLIFIMIALNDINACLNSIEKNYINILKKISFCLYTLFLRFILNDLKNIKYNDLSCVILINQIFSSYPKSIINLDLPNNKIYSLIQKSFDLCLDSFRKILNNNDFMEEIFLSLKNALLSINKKDLLYYIDISLNVYLYTLLNKNIQKAILNSNNNKNKYGLISVPYLPKKMEEFKYTIVLDMDETLGHLITNEIKTNNFSNYGYLISDDKNNFNKNSENKDKIKTGLFLIRPYTKYFLNELRNLNYEIVVFTAGTKEYCDKVLDILDINNNLINFRLYRAHLSLRNINQDVKDLSLLGRDLNKIIMIDNLPENYKLQKDNGLPINSWIGDINDSSLKDLLIIMKYIVKNNINDVREIIKKIKTQLGNDINYGKIELY